MADNILYVPIQINGGTDTEPTLLDRELYVLEDGTLYVGIKDADGTIKIKNVLGNVIPNATIVGASLADCTLGRTVAGEGMIFNSEAELESAIENGDVLEGQLCFFKDE